MISYILYLSLVLVLNCIITWRRILCRGLFTDTMSKKHSHNYRWQFQWVFFQYLHKRLWFVMIDTCNPLLNTCKKMKLIIQLADEFSIFVINLDFKTAISAHHFVRKLGNYTSCFLHYSLCLWLLTKYLIQTIRQRYPSTSGCLHKLTSTCFTAFEGTGMLCSLLFISSFKSPCFWRSSQDLI